MPVLFGRDWPATRNKTRLESDLRYFNRETTTKYLLLKCFKMRSHTQVNKRKTRAGGRQSTKVLWGWPVPYTMKPKVEVEEKRLEEEKILHKVKFSNWSIPIVPVIKPNGPVLTCGDYKITVNPQRQPKKYPPPSHRWHICWAGRGGGDEVHQDWLHTGIPSDGGGGRVTRVLNDLHPPRIVPMQSPGIWDSLSHLTEINTSNPRRNRRNKLHLRRLLREKMMKSILVTWRKYWTGERNMAYEQIVANASFSRQRLLTVDTY